MHISFVTALNICPSASEAYRQDVDLSHTTQSQIINSTYARNCVYIKRRPERMKKNTRHAHDEQDLSDSLPYFLVQIIMTLTDVDDSV